MRVGSIIAIARDRAADQARIILAQPRQREPELVHRAWLEVLYQDVCAGDQRLQARASVYGGEIDNDRVLAAIEPDEVAALALCRRVIAARKVAFRTFHLDHMRAGIRQPRAAERRCNRLLDCDDDYSLKR